MAPMEKAADPPLVDDIERIATILVDAAREVFLGIGPGFHERVYQSALEHELRSRGMRVEAKKAFEATTRA